MTSHPEDNRWENPQNKEIEIEGYEGKIVSVERSYTVGTLIEKLKEFDPDMLVIAKDGLDGGEDRPIGDKWGVMESEYIVWGRRGMPDNRVPAVHIWGNM